MELDTACEVGLDAGLLSGVLAGGLGASVLLHESLPLLQRLVEATAVFDTRVLVLLVSVPLKTGVLHHRAVGHPTSFIDVQVLGRVMNLLAVSIV